MARMLGFIFPENFNNPYISQSITEFWRRWHMTLSRWMRDYLYIPLGGNKVNKERLYINLWIVFLLSGLWHGASWNFVVWGTFHGLFLIADRIFLLKFLSRIGKIPAIAFTFLITLIGWTFFRIDDINIAFGFIAKLFSFNFSENSYFFDTKFQFIFFLGFVFSFITTFKFGEIIENYFYKTIVSVRESYYKSGIAVILFIICLANLAISGFNPFIYFRF